MVLPAYDDPGCAFETISEEILLMDYSQSVFEPDPRTLCFALNSGDTLCFSDSASLHQVCSFLPEQNYWTIFVFGFEHSAFMLINVDSGWRTFCLSPPVPSPDLERLLCVWSTPYSSFNENGIQIFRIEDDSLVTEFSAIGIDWAIENVRWLSESIIGYNKSSFFPEEGDDAEMGTLTLTSDGNWVADNPDHFGEEPFREEIWIFDWVHELYLD